MCGCPTFNEIVKTQEDWKNQQSEQGDIYIEDFFSRFYVVFIVSVKKIQFLDSCVCGKSYLSINNCQYKEAAGMDCG